MIVNDKDFWKAYIKSILTLLFIAFTRHIPDRIYAHIEYFLIFKRILSLHSPKTFNEKLIYLKLSYSDPQYALFCDKVNVRTYVQEKIGDHILPKVYFCWENPRDIPFDTLPEKYVIKCNHSSWRNILVTQGKTISRKKMISLLSLWLKEDFRVLHRELNYKYVKKQILIEELLGENLLDYKVFCFDGTPTWVQIHVDRFWNYKQCFYDIHWNKLPFSTEYTLYEGHIDPPKNLSTMLAYASILGKDFKTVRIDFYEVENRIYFWEITLIHAWGVARFRDIHHAHRFEWDRMYGDLIPL